MNPFNKSGDDGTGTGINTGTTGSVPPRASILAGPTFRSATARCISSRIRFSSPRKGRRPGGAAPFASNIAYIGASNTYNVIVPMSVYQAMSTRNGGEVISSDSY